MLTQVQIFYPKSRSQLSKMRLGEEDPYANLSEEVGFGFGTGHQVRLEAHHRPSLTCSDHGRGRGAARVFPLPADRNRDRMSRRRRPS